MKNNLKNYSLVNKDGIFAFPDVNSPVKGLMLSQCVLILPSCVCVCVCISVCVFVSVCVSSLLAIIVPTPGVVVWFSKFFKKIMFKGTFKPS